MHEWTPVTDWNLPFTLGHENAGLIKGGESIGLDSGIPVVVSPTWSCGICRACRSGATNYCETEPAFSGAMGRDGGVAELMAAPANCLIPLRDLEP